MEELYGKWRQVPLPVRVATVIALHLVLFILTARNEDGDIRVGWVAVLGILTVGNLMLLVRDR